MRHHRPPSAHDLITRDVRQSELLKEVLAEPNWEREVCKAGMSLMFRKGVVIVGLFILCAVLFGATANPLVPTLLFVVATIFILFWDWSPPKESEPD